jgi:hypothetical protein
MAKEPEPPRPIRWNIYKIASRAIWVGEVEAPDETAAMGKAAVEFRAPAKKLIATRQPSTKELASARKRHRSGVASYVHPNGKGDPKAALEKQQARLR